MLAMVSLLRVSCVSYLMSLGTYVRESSLLKALAVWSLAPMPCFRPRLPAPPSATLPKKY